jgi:type VI secretion system protein ImpC
MTILLENRKIPKPNMTILLKNRTSAPKNMTILLENRTFPPARFLLPNALTPNYTVSITSPIQGSTPMAKKKDDPSFSFSSKKKKPEPKPEETPAEETPADPFASTDPAADPFASTDTSSDPFASTDTSSDPFASTDTSSDPFASTDTSADPFATTETPTEEPAAEAPAEETPAGSAKPEKKTPKLKEHKQFRILILGDFSGRANQQKMETGDAVAQRKVRNIDADSFDRILAGLKPEIHLPVSETSAVTLKFTKLEDFRPDGAGGVLAQMEAFQGMLKLRDDLKNPKTFKTAAAAVRKLTGEKKPAKTAPKGAEKGSDFEQLLSKPFAPKNATNATADALIANLVAGYEVPDADPDQARLTKLIEDALSAGLRAVLRHPAFQAIESSWRGVELLTSRLNTDEDLKINIFDISKDELYADLMTPPSVDKSGLFQVLVEQTKIPGVEPFAVVVGNFQFDQTPRDISLLARIATLMNQAGIPFLAGATPKVAGFPSFAKFPDSGKWQPPADIAMWDKIRAHKAAAHLGLAAPRFLMRLPYGPKTDPIDSYPFEELPGNTGSAGGAGAEGGGGYLWGNGAFLVALGMGEAFLEDGWGFEPHTDVTDLPCHMAIVDGDKEMTPCAEGWLSDRVAAILHDLGLIPLLSVKNAASVKVAGIHSIAKGGSKPLAANWAKQS